MLLWKILMIIKDNIWFILIISETKLDDSFLLNQFYIDGLAVSIRFDRKKHVGGIKLYAREEVPLKFLSSGATPFEGFFMIWCGGAEQMDDGFL